MSLCSAKASRTDIDMSLTVRRVGLIHLASKARFPPASQSVNNLGPTRESFPNRASSSEGRVQERRHQSAKSHPTSFGSAARQPRYTTALLVHEIVVLGVSMHGVA